MTTEHRVNPTDEDGGEYNDEQEAPSVTKPSRGGRGNKRTRQQGNGPASSGNNEETRDELPQVAQELLRVLNSGSSRTGPQNYDTARMFASYYDTLARDRHRFQDWMLGLGYSGPLVNRCVQTVFGLRDVGQEYYNPGGSQGAMGYHWTPQGFVPMPIIMNGGGERKDQSYPPSILFPPQDSSRDVDRLRDEFREQLREERERYHRELEMSTSRLETTLERLADQMGQLGQVVQMGQQSNGAYRRYRRPRLGPEGEILTDPEGRELYDEVEEPYDLETERLRAQMDIMRQSQPPPPAPAQTVDVEGLFGRLTEKMEYQRDLDRKAHQRELDEIKHSIEIQTVRAETEREAAERIRQEEVRPLQIAYQEANTRLSEAENSKDLPVEEVARRDTLDRVERFADKIGSKFDTLFDKFDQQQRYAVAAQSGLAPPGKVEAVTPERQQEILNRVRSRAMGRTE